MRPFRFGVGARYATSRCEWQEKARRAEALGYSTFLVPDHLAPIVPPLLPLVSAAEATSTLRVGTYVLNNDFRHPAFVAREAATLDLLTDGRFELGLGAGHMQSEYDEVGLAFDPPGTRVERLAEAVPIVKALLAGDKVTHTGIHYRVQAHSVFPAGPHNVPILIGGNGRRLLELAAREADIVGFVGFSHRRGGTDVDLSSFGETGAAERIGIVREAAGERFQDIELNALVQRVVVTRDPEASTGELAADWGLAPDVAATSPYLLFGSHEGMAEQLEARRERLGISYVVVPEDALDDFAPVVSHLL